MKKFFLYLLIILPSLCWGQDNVKARIFYSNSVQLEELFHDFIVEETESPYYSDSLTYLLTITSCDSIFFCKFRSGTSYFRNDSVFIEDEYLSPPQEYIFLNNRLVQVFFYNEGENTPCIPFIASSNDYCTVIGTTTKQYEVMVDDAIIPASWEFYFKNGSFQIIKKHAGVY